MWRKAKNGLRLHRRLNCEKKASAEKAEAQKQRVIYSPHNVGRKLADFFLYSAFVYRAYLFQQHNRILGHWRRTAAQFDVSGKFGFGEARRSSRRDNSRTVLVAYVVLQHNYRTNAALFASNNGVEVGVVDFSSFYQCSRSLCVRALPLTCGRISTCSTVILCTKRINRLHRRGQISAFGTKTLRRGDESAAERARICNCALLSEIMHALTQKYTDLRR